MSSHREAPEISKDPVADSTDVYAFVSPDQPDTVTLIANYIPLQGPAGGPNFYEFGDDVLYEIHIDNDGDAKPDITYQFRFTTRVRNQRTFLYNTGQITSLDDPDWNRRQTYSVTKLVKGHSPKGSRVPGSVPAVQHRPAVDTELRQPRQHGHPDAPNWREGLRWPAGRGFLFRPGLDLRPRRAVAGPEPASAAAAARARRERDRSAQRAHDCTAGADHGSHQERADAIRAGRSAGDHRGVHIG